MTEELIDAACFVSAPTAEGPPDTEPTSDAASDGAQAVLSENELAPTTQAPDPFDDDEYRLKKSRRKHAAEKNVTAIRTPLKFEPVTDLLTVVRVQLVPRLPRLREAAAALPHFGSGPCHSIPRPRESTIDLPFQSAALLA